MSHPSNEWWRAQRARLIRDFGGRCERCRTRERLEFAHVEHTPVCDIPRGRGRNQRIRDIHRDPSAFALLCVWCHRQFDQGRFKVRGFRCFRARAPRVDFASTPHRTEAW